MKNSKLKEIVTCIESLDMEDLHELSNRITTIIKNKSKSVDIELCYNRFKGSGKCWIAEVDKGTKKILSFINEESVIKDDNHKGSKIFKLKDGYYLLNETGTKSKDSRRYINIEKGIIIDF